MLSYAIVGFLNRQMLLGRLHEIETQCRCTNLPPSTDLDALAERFKKRGYSPVVLPRKHALSPVERVTPSDCSAPLSVIPGLTRNPGLQT